MSKKVLLVDDDLGICDSLAMLLRDEGYSVDAVTDSGEGASLIKKYRYDVGIFDYKMKGLNGIDLLKIIKDENPQCPVFIISGMLNINELCKTQTKAGLLAGVIVKPFDVDALLKRIAAII
jgi:DNA-binding NtrC family response regulator